MNAMRILGSLAVATLAGQLPVTTNIPVYTYQVVRTYPHDPAAFTQGLEFVDGALYEGTGLNGRSSIRKVKLDTGEVLQRRDISSEYFGEGITLWKTDLIERTAAGVSLPDACRALDLRLATVKGWLTRGRREKASASATMTSE